MPPTRVTLAELDAETLAILPRAASYQKTLGPAMSVATEGAQRFISIAAVGALQGARYGMKMRPN
jgi:uncharacterized membrane protein (DUF4010 family)